MPDQEQQPLTEATEPVNGDRSPMERAVQESVRQLVSGAKWSKRAVAALSVLAVALAGVVAYLGFTASSQSNQIAALKTYVQQYAQHSCQALELLSAKPVPQPADPAANPSREATYNFYEAILYWEHKDGCSVVAVPVARG